MPLKSPAPITGIDSHAHVFRHDLPMAAERRYAPDYDATVQMYLSHLDRWGLSHGVLIQPSFLGTDNHHLLAAIARQGDRLRGVAVVSPEASEADFDRLASGGTVGIRLNLVGQPLAAYHQTHWRSFFERVARRGWSVEIQRRMADLATIIVPIRDAGVSVVVDHYGLPPGPIDRSQPAHRAFLELLADDGVWVKLSAAYRCNASLVQARASLAALREARGALDRLVWGSDWPHTRFENQTNYEEQWRALAELLPDVAERQRILIDNPARLFGFEASGGLSNRQASRAAT